MLLAELMQLLERGDVSIRFDYDPVSSGMNVTIWPPAHYTPQETQDLTACVQAHLGEIFVRVRGGSESGSYYLTSFESGSGQSMGAWVPSLSRTTTPLSVTIDTSITSPSFCANPSTDHLNSSGFHIYSTSAGASGNAMNCAGNWTVQY